MVVKLEIYEGKLQQKSCSASIAVNGLTIYFIEDYCVEF